MLQQVAQQAMVTVLEDATHTLIPDPNAVNHRITVERGTATAGTVALTAKADTSQTAEVVYDIYGAAITWDLSVAGAETQIIQNQHLSSLILTQTGSNGTIKVAYACW